MHSQLESSSRNPRGEARRTRRWLRRFAALLVIVVLLVAAAPYVAQVPPMRDWIVNAVAERENVRAEVGGASFGWFTPFALHDLRVDSPYGDPLLDVSRIEAARPLWELAVSRNRLGRFSITDPHVTLIAKPSGWNFEGIGPKEEEEAEDGKAPGRKPELIAELRNATVELYRAGVDEPLVDVAGVNATMQIKYVDDTRWLTVQPFQPLDHKQLTPEMCDNGLQLIAPILANATWVEGEASLAIDEFRLPLDRSTLPAARDEEPTAVASGRLDLHSVETGLKNPVLEEIAAKIATLLGTEMPTRVRIADESLVRFELRDRRVYHEGLAFGLPEIAPSLLIHTSGTVGLDKTLDLRAQVPLPLDLAFNGPIAQRVSGKTIELAVTGTLDEPKVSFPPERSMMQQVVGLLRETPEDPSEPTEVVADDVVGLAQELLPVARDVSQEVVEGLADTVARIRERRAERRAARDAQDGPREEELARGFGDEGADFSGDALPPSPPDDSEFAGGARRDEGAAERETDDELNPRRRQGPLRRLLDRARRSQDG